MQQARYLVALSCACASTACGTEIATAVEPPRVDAGPPGVPERPPQCNSTKIIDRLIQTTIPLTEGVRYKRSLSYFGLPQDERIALSSSPNNVSLVAWLNLAGTHVHVTRLAMTRTEIARFGTDYTVEGTELGGLVALDDGFALLTRRPDLGDPLGEGGMPTQATYLVRWRNDVEVFAAALTGTKSIVNVADADLNLKRDFPLTNGVSGRLVFNGSHYGAYFVARGGQGDRWFDQFADKFVQVDAGGGFVSGWRMGCRVYLGGRLVADGSRFVPFCMSDGRIETPGLTLVLGPFATRRLAYETYAEQYAGGNFGSAVKTNNGFLVAWASRGVNIMGNSISPAHDFHEPAVALVDNDLNPVPPPDWPFLPGSARRVRDAVNVHAAPYGDDKVLIVWETIDSPTYRPNSGYSTGTYGGTHFRFVDAAGKPASEPEMVPSAIAPNGQDEIVQLPNRDLVWAYVPEEPRDFQTPVSSVQLPNLPVISKIGFVRLLYCPP
jgi:hypothetical protein